MIREKKRKKIRKTIRRRIFFSRRELNNAVIKYRYNFGTELSVAAHSFGRVETRAKRRILKIVRSEFAK